MPTTLIEHSWLGQITKYTTEGQFYHGLSLYHKIRKQVDEIPPSHFFPTLLKACTNLKSFEAGLSIHVDAVRTGLLENNLFISTSLVSLYMKCGLVTKACQVFNKVHIRNIVLWTALISGYVENGLGKEALRCVSLMRAEEISPNAVTFVSILNACSSLGYLDKGREAHSEVERMGLLKENVFVGSALIDMYAKCGLLNRAQEVLNNLSLRNVISWTALIAGYADHGYYDEALKCFEQMHSESVSPNVTTLVCVLKACISVGAIDKGQELHEEMERKGLIEEEPLLCSTLVHLYANGGMFVKACQLFNMLSERDVVAWTALISGYVYHGHGEEALSCLEQMQLEGNFPNSFTFVCGLMACGVLKAADKGSKLHVELESLGLTKDNVFIGTSLVDMYAKCGLLVEAQQAFDKFAIRNTELWNALITAYVEHDLCEVAMECFKQMQLEGVSPDPVTFMYGLRACCSIGATNKGAELHAEIARKGLLAEHCVLGNSLLCMYARWGSLAMAQQVFNGLPFRNIFTWNSLLVGYSQIGEKKGVFCSVEAMLADGAKPDPVSSLIVRHACSRSGLSLKSHDYREAVNKENHALPAFKHHSFVSDVVDCAGQQGTAEVMVVTSLPIWSNVASWTRMLCASRYLGNEELGKQAFELSVMDR